MLVFTNKKTKLNLSFHSEKFISSSFTTGNVTVLLVVFMNKSMRTTINVLLFNLSLSDVLYILLSVPGYLSTEICNQRWMLGLVMAIICQGFTILTAAASVFTLIGIAFERLELLYNHLYLCILSCTVALGTGHGDNCPMNFHCDEYHTIVACKVYILRSLYYIYNQLRSNNTKYLGI